MDNKIVDLLDPINEITDIVIGCSYTVANTLGCGFLEKVYENAFAIEIRKAGLKAEQQAPIPVYYSGEVVGDYFADILVEDQLIVELKVVKELTDAHKAQCLNYLAGTKMPLCLLINFYNPKVQIKRIIARTVDLPIPKTK